MKGFKVFWVRGKRRVEKMFTICGTEMVVLTKLIEGESILEIAEVKPAPVWKFRKVVGTGENFGFSSYGGGSCKKRRGIYLDGERIDGEMIPKNPIGRFLSGEKVIVVSIDKWISIFEFPGKDFKRIPIDEVMMIALDILGEKEIVKMIKEVLVWN